MTGTRNVTWLVAVTATLLLAGCQASPPITSVRYDNIGFMALWKTYTHCLSTEDSQLAVEDAQKLSSMSRIDTTVSSRPKHALLSIPFAGEVPKQPQGWLWMYRLWQRLAAFTQEYLQLQQENLS